MPYQDFSGTLTHDHSLRQWQVRIAIDPSVLIEDDPNNKIEEIKKILADVFADFPTNLKIWLIPNEQALYDGEYDGTTSKKGKDREQRGKEVCIYLADTEHAHTVDDYKEKLLTLWHKLQEAGIPLMYLNVPGDRKIQGPSDLPTPFSITSFTQGKEWLDRHGILFKQFVPWDDKHPILKVKLNEKDLKAHKIRFDPIQIAKLNRDYFKKHQDNAIELLQKDILNIENQKDSYRKILFDDDVITRIKNQIKPYRDKIKDLKVDDRGAFQKKFTEGIQKDEMLQLILNNYPHDTDFGFSDHVAIRTLRRLDQVEEDQFDVLIKQLRDDYEQKVSDIKPDFDKHVNGDDKTPKTMRIDWSNYIPRYNDNLCKKLIENNPAQMQAMYRRIILLERERQAHEEFKKQWLKAHYGNDKAYKQLTKLAKEVKHMEKNVENKQHKIKADVLKNFQALYTKIEDEIFSHKKCNIDKTSYPVVIEHFTTMAQEINSGEEHTVENMTLSSTKLDKKLLDKQPMNKAVKAVICGVIGAVVGAIIGFGVGAAVTFWGGSFGSLPAAIAGGMAGFTLAQGLAVGGAALGAGVGGGVIGAVAGFFSAKKNQAAYQATYLEKQQDKRAIVKEINDVYESMGFKRQ